MCLAKVQPHRNFRQKRYLLVVLLIDWQNWFLLSVVKYVVSVGNTLVGETPELHSGKLSFEEVGATEWLPMFYFACKVLLESMDRKLADFFSDPVAAEELINSLQEDAKKICVERNRGPTKRFGQIRMTAKRDMHLSDQLCGHCVILGTA